MLVDVGVNLLNGQFRKDTDAIVSRARAAGVADLLVIATDLDSSAQAISMGETSGLRCTAGVHPHDAKDVERGWQYRLRELAQHPRVCAVGETGLDFNRNYSPPEQQLAVFAEQIAIAQEIDKPLYVHDRESRGELLNLLSAAGTLPPVLVHCFTGTAAELEAYLAAGFHIGITGWVTDPKRGELLRELIPHIPLEHLLIETDAPFLRPFNVPAEWLGHHGLSSRHKRRCEPAMLPYVLECVAQLRTEQPDEIAAATSANAHRLFGVGQPGDRETATPGQR
jgi:TatD DNase family protein